ncbi:Ulp1 protease family, C-terminal catalytic domain [Sesbania bispinosa]|nr:Ulp1 protease family, C-terminal catalytic domain [Sesbania bispinosa]
MTRGQRRVNQEFDLTKKVRVRNSCEVKFLSEVNNRLTPLQVACLNRTPFRWTPEIPDDLTICGPLLLQLALRWSDNSGGFRIRSTIVPFTPVDVCLALCVPIVGQKVSFDESAMSHTRSLLEGDRIKVSNIMQQLDDLNGDEDVEDFCRLYLLLAFAEFYFPWTSSIVNTRLSRAHEVLSEGRNSSQVHIVGCVAVLQLWAIQHLSMCPTGLHSSFNLFPRFKSWQNMHRPTKDIQSAFDTNGVVYDAGVTANEIKQFPVLKKAMDEALCGYHNCPAMSWRMQDLATMKPRGWVCNTVFLLAPRVFMADEIGRCGYDAVIAELELFENGLQKRWTSRSFRDLLHDATTIDQLRPCNLVFAPALFQNHWFCYVLDKEREKMFVLDSLGSKSRQQRMKLDNAMSHLGELLHIIKPNAQRSSADFVMEYVDLPRQRNSHDCGIYVLKYMEAWDGVTIYGDKTMPEYSLKDIHVIRT